MIKIIKYKKNIIEFIIPNFDDLSGIIKKNLCIIER